MENWIYISLAILWFIGVLWWDVVSDYRKIEHNIPINHTKEGILRCFLLAPSALGFWLANPSLISVPIIIFMQGAWYWEFFDGLLNRKRDLPWRYNGSHEPDGSKLDSFLYHISSTKQALLKWGLIILTTSGYVLTSFV